MSLFSPTPGANVDINFNKRGLEITLYPAPDLQDLKATLFLRWTEMLLIIFLLVVGGLIVHFRHQIAGTYLLATWAPAHLGTTVTVMTAIAFLLGLIITFWKKKQLFTYSIAEIAFALFTVFQIGWRLWPQAILADFLALGSALYVVSRGFSNLWDAFKEETEIERLKLQLGTENLMDKKQLAG